MRKPAAGIIGINGIYLRIRLDHMITFGETPFVELHKPRNVSPYAEACLRALADAGYGEKVSLGGAFALAYYFEYRETHDIDAWWQPEAAPEDRRGVVACLQRALSPFGEVRTREWGQVVSVELAVGGKLVFSFQIAQRDAQLEPSQTAPWPPDFRVDAFADLVGAKMVALVERGAPRDFRDIHALCVARLTDPTSCWNTWRRRQQLAHRDASRERALLAVQTHLARIEAHRPLDGIRDPGERSRAAEVRAWFRERFIHALMD